MNEELEKKIAKEAFERLIKVCKLHGVNYLELDKNMQGLMLSIYHEGIKFVNDTLKDRAEIILK